MPATAPTSAISPHDDAEREYAYGPAGGLPDTHVGTFSQALMDTRKASGWTVISMKHDWKTTFAGEAGHREGEMNGAGKTEKQMTAVPMIKSVMPPTAAILMGGAAAVQTGLAKLVSSGEDSVNLDGRRGRGPNVAQSSPGERFRNSRDGGPCISRGPCLHGGRVDWRRLPLFARARRCVSGDDSHGDQRLS